MRKLNVYPKQVAWVAKAGTRALSLVHSEGQEIRYLRIIHILFSPLMFKSSLLHVVCRVVGEGCQEQEERPEAQWKSATIPLMTVGALDVCERSQNKGGEGVDAGPCQKPPPFLSVGNQGNPAKSHSSQDVLQAKLWMYANFNQKKAWWQGLTTSNAGGLKCLFTDALK